MSLDSVAIRSQIMSSTAYSIIVPTLALAACLLSIPPLLVHVKARNFAATILSGGIAILNLQNFVNALIWTSDDGSSWWRGQILCDVEVKLYIGIGLAVDGAIACIFRQISIILDTENMVVIPSPRQQRVRLAIEACLCIVLPCFVMGAHYLVQKSRYYIRRFSGCTPSFDNCWATPFLIYMWPLIVCLVASVYCILSLARLSKHRRQVASVLSNTPAAAKSRFRRLFALAITLLVLYLPLTVIAFADNMSIPLHTYSWSYIHPHDWAERIILYTPVDKLSFDRWAQIITAYILFGFFGLGRDAMQMYRDWLKVGGRLFVACHLTKSRPLETTAHESSFPGTSGLDT